MLIWRIPSLKVTAQRLTSLRPNDDRAAPAMHCSAMRYSRPGPSLHHRARHITAGLHESCTHTHTHSLLPYEAGMGYFRTPSAWRIWSRTCVVPRTTGKSRPDELFLLAARGMSGKTSGWQRLVHESEGRMGGRRASCWCTSQARG